MGLSTFWQWSEKLVRDIPVMKKYFWSPFRSWQQLPLVRCSVEMTDNSPADNVFAKCLKLRLSDSYHHLI